MERTITVTGVGHASAAPDIIILELCIENIHKVHEKAMENHAKLIDELRKALGSIGFSKQDLKTSSFSVNTSYHSERDKNDNYKSVFDGYEVSNTLRLEFECDTERLSDVLTAVSNTKASPQINISFSVKDTESFKNEMLRDACIKAKCKAEILAAASDVKLGELISINHSWSTVDVFSDTEYEHRLCNCSEIGSSPDIVPNDISISDSVTFVWKIV